MTKTKSKTKATPRWQDVFHTLQHEYKNVMEQRFNETENPDDNLTQMFHDSKEIQLIVTYDLDVPCFNEALDLKYRDKFQRLYDKMVNDPRHLMIVNKRSIKAMDFLTNNKCFIHHCYHDNDGYLTAGDTFTKRTYWGILASMITWKYRIDDYHGTFKQDEMIHLPQVEDISHRWLSVSF